MASIEVQGSVPDECTKSSARPKLTLNWNRKSLPVPDVFFDDYVEPTPTAAVAAPLASNLALPPAPVTPVTLRPVPKVAPLNMIRKYARALGSSNLRDDAQHHHTEVLAAAALCRDLGTKLFRVKYASDATSYPALLEAWREMVVTKAAHRNWPADISPAKVARLSLDHWLNDVCQECTGRGYEPVKGVPSVMSDVECKICRGTGRRAVKAKHNEVQLVEDMVEALEAISAHAAGQTMRRLATGMDI